MARVQAGLRRHRVRSRDTADERHEEDVAERRGDYGDLTDAIATARAVRARRQLTRDDDLVRSILHPKYGARRRFDEFQALNVQGMIAWRTGKSPAAH